MAVYNLSEFIEIIKEEAEIGDLPLPVTDQQIIKHLDQLTMVDFSILYPMIEEVVLSDDHIDKGNQHAANQYQVYKIPKWVYEGTKVLNVFDFRPYYRMGMNDLYIPNNAGWASPDSILGAIADVRLAAGVASTMSKALTIKFKSPDKIICYNGWMNGQYLAEVGLKHPINLSTIDPGTFPTLRELAVMDLKAYLYGKLKRKDGISTGVGELDLKISEWSDSARERKDWFKEMKEECNMDFAHIIRW